MAKDTDRYERVSAAFTDRVEGCRGDRWSAPSPCDGWAARDVVRHVVDTHRRLVAGLEGTEAEPLPADADLDVARAGVLGALRDPDRAARPVGAGSAPCRSSSSPAAC